MEGVEGMEVNRTKAKVDAAKAQAARFALIREAMPGVQSVVADKRRELGDAWVTECIQRGMAGEPGWFFAREGGVAIGTPFPTDDPALVHWALRQVTSTQATVMLRPRP